MEKILLDYGKLTSLSDKTGISAPTCSKYLKGFYDADKPDVKEKADQVRKLAIQMGGAVVK